MNTFHKILALSLLSLVGIGMPASSARADVSISFDTYAAVAYSPSTGKFGYAWNWHSRFTAESVALSNCKASDAKIVGWVKGGWLVLAVSDDNAYGVGYTFGDGASSGEAQIRALRNCTNNSTSLSQPKIKVILCSGNYGPQVFE